MRYIRSMVDAAVARGAGMDEALRWAGDGLDAELLGMPRARVSLQQFSRMYGAAAQCLQDEGAGLSAYRIPLGAVETICRSGTTAASLAECVAIFGKALNASVHGLRVGTEADADGVHLLLNEASPIDGPRALTYEVILLTLYAAMSWLFGRRLPLLSADFPCAAPRHLFELRTLFAGPLRFNQASAALRFRPEHASLQVQRAPTELPKLLRRAPASLIDALLTRGELAMEVRKRLHRSLPVLPPLDDMACQLAMSPRSLHRKLQAEGESFQKIKDELRRDLAVNALTRTDTALKQIATDLGFLDQASFQRAFFQWMGHPPGVWRRKFAAG